MSLANRFTQTLAMIPGVSRSDATIVSALMMGADRRAAAAFSFFPSMPAIAGAFACDLYKNRNGPEAGVMNEIAIGFVMSLAFAVLVASWLLNYVSKHGDALFGGWRIIVGGLALTALSLGF
tara:strand:- start:12135 stop:12500 length:366 start_codon:yes stop_codon:yes gene_type:complete